jgi:hypothetical protein
MQSLERAEELAREHGSVVFAERAARAREQIRSRASSRRLVDRSVGGSSAATT